MEALCGQKRWVPSPLSNLLSRTKPNREALSHAFQASWDMLHNSAEFSANNTFLLTTFTSPFLTNFR